MSKSRSYGSYGGYRKQRDEAKNQNTLVRVPRGMELFTIEKSCVKYLDIFPYETKKDVPGGASAGMLFAVKSYRSHTIGPDFQKFCCPKENWGKRCPICDEYDKVRKRDGWESAKHLYPKERQLWLVKDLKDPEKGIQLWDISYHLFGKQLDEKLENAEESEQERLSEFWKLESGLTLRVALKEKTFSDRGKKGKPWYEAVDIEFRKRKEQYTEDLLDELPCLDDLLIERDYDEICQLFNPTLDDDEEEEDDSFDDDGPDEDELDELANTPAPWDGDEEDDDEVADEEEAVPAAPAPKSKRGQTKKAKPEWEEEDWE